MNDILQDISESLMIPYDDIIKSFDKLKSQGYICTFAASLKELADKKQPVRLAGVPPIDSDSPSEVSFGPFVLEREHYERVSSSITDSDALRIYLGFTRLSYEKTGNAAVGYHFEAEEEALCEFLSLMDLWDIEHPVVYEHFVWILPTEECKQLVEEIMGETFVQDDFSWWNARIDLGKGIMPTTIDHYPNGYGLVPDVVIDRWAKYLPGAVFSALFLLYMRATTGGGFRTFSNLSEIVEVIDRSLTIELTSDADRELLIKELCDFNRLPYPVGAHTAFDYLCKIGFIVISQYRTQVEYSLATDIPLPEDVLHTPKGWEDRVDKYLSTGSVLFSYLTLEEIVTD